MAEESQEGPKELELVYTVFKDGVNLGFESLKHLTTLNAGSIVLIATFLRDIFPHQISLGLKFLVAGSFMLFGLSLATAALLIYFFMQARHHMEDFLVGELITVAGISMEFSAEDSPAWNVPRGLQRGVARWRTLFLWVVVPFLLFFSGLGSFGLAVVIDLF